MDNMHPQFGDIVCTIPAPKPSRKTIVALFCIDKHFALPMHEFVYRRVMNGTEFYPIPTRGSCGSLSRLGDTPDNAALAKLRFIKEHGEIHSAILVHHEDCLFYKVKLGLQRPEDVVWNQLLDFQASTRILADEFNVHTFQYFLATGRYEKNISIASLGGQNDLGRHLMSCRKYIHGKRGSSQPFGETTTLL